MLEMPPWQLSPSVRIIRGGFYSAGLKAVGESLAESFSYYANNVQGTLSLLEAMQASATKASMKKFCFH
jgi:UDP-glucose 4-epimerase